MYRESPRMVAGPHEVRVTNKEPVSQMLVICSLGPSLQHGFPASPAFCMSDFKEAS